VQGISALGVLVAHLRDVAFSRTSPSRGKPRAQRPPGTRSKWPYSARRKWTRSNASLAGRPVRLPSAAA